MLNKTLYTTPLDDDLFYSIQEFILSKVGVLIPITKRYLFENRLSPLAEQHGFSSTNEYFTYISQQNTRHPLYLEFIHSVTTHETSFFRHTKQLQTFIENILPQYLANKKDKNITIWSAGSSTGEELYSIAMLIHMYLEQSAKDFSLSLVGTDISQEVVRTAQKALYHTSFLQNIPEQYKNAYTTHVTSSTFSINEKITCLSSFKEDNLPATLLSENMLFDFIFCRNVLIYFDDINAISALYGIKTRLKDDGLFFIGHSENTKIIHTLFTPSQNDPMILHKK
ncbi:MAG: CheR family methyltransferase [Desulfovibrionaceae bacterium]